MERVGMNLRKGKEAYIASPERRRVKGEMSSLCYNPQK